MAKKTTTTTRKKTTTAKAKKKAPVKKATKRVAKKTVKRPAAKKTPAKKAATKKTAAKKTVKKAAPTPKPKVSPRSSATKLAATSTRTTDDNVWQKLKNWNLGLGLLHAAQAVTMALLAKDFRLPLDVNFLTFNDATESLDTTSRTIADVPLAWLIIAFLAMSAVAHAIIAGPWFDNYKKDLSRGINRARWIEYSLSASTMMVAIGFLVGITSLSLFITIFALTAVMNLCGYIMEVHNQDTKQTSWISFVVGSIAGIIPWIVIGLFFLSNWLYGSGQPPTFVYVIYISIFLFFNAFAINMYKQYKKKGKWADYLYGEKAYMVLSLVAKSALAWQVFAGTLR